MLTLIAFASIISSSYGATKFVIDYYTLPDPDNIFTGGTLSAASPFPLDVCLSYEVALAGFSPLNYYGIYSCNQAGDEVIFTDYGTDDTCTTEDGTNSKTIPYDAQLADGDLLTFNCDGETNYVQVAAYTFIGDTSSQTEGGGLCCGDEGSATLAGIAVTTFATDVCISTGIGDTTGYTKGYCDNEGSETLIYTDNTCNTATGESSAEGAASTSSCPLFTGGQLSVYRLQTNCVINGVEDNPVTDYCDLTPMPTTAEPSEMPTKSPTPEPTPVTEAPTTAEPTASPTTSEPTTAAPTEVQEAKSKGFIFIVNYVLLLVLVMAIFVN